MAKESKMKKPLMRRFISVQGNYYLVKNDKIYPFKRQTIIDLYGKDSLDSFESFDTFTVEPNHLEHRESVKGDWNLYAKIKNKPSKGNWKTIEYFLNHIFREQYNMGLEYFWNLYVNPKQRLPLLGLVSKKKKTGKSTFLEFVKMIFELNSIIIDHEDLTGSYNGSWAGKLAVMIDEKPDGKTALKELQKLKRLITSFSIVRKEKYQANSEIPNFCKFIMASNDNDSMIRIEDENTRFWILDISPIEKEDFNIYQKLKAEIPAFLYFLHNEFQPRPARGRIYFNPDEFQTKASIRIQSKSKPALQVEIEAILERALYQPHSEILNKSNSKLFFSPKDMADSLKGKYEVKYIRKILDSMNTIGKMKKQIRYSDNLNNGSKRRGCPYFVIEPPSQSKSNLQEGSVDNHNLN